MTISPVEAARHARPPRHILHVFPSFGVGGVPLRMVRVINHFAAQLRHTVVALDRDLSAGQKLGTGLDVALIAGEGKRRGLARSLFEAGNALRRLRPDLLITYNWGAIEWAMANRLFPVSPQIHCEAGFGRDEADRQLRRRVLFRRWALVRCRRVVVPSRRLETIALGVWKLPPAQLAFIPNGVDVERYAALRPDALPGFARGPNEVVVGTVAPLRPEKNLGRLLRAFAGLDPALAARLIIAGDGAERAALAHLAAELGIAERVLFTGQIAPELALGSFDVFALSSDTEQMPNALLEAMASGRAVAAVDVGDVRHMVSKANREFIVPRDDGNAFTRAIERLLRDPARRAELGRANRRRAIEAFSQDRMLAAYGAIFGLDG